MSDCFWKPLEWEDGNVDWMIISSLYTILQAQRTLNIKADYRDYSDEPSHLSLSASLFPFLSLLLSVSVSHSAYRSLQWSEARRQTAWRWQPAREPFQAPLSEGDRGLGTCQLGTALEPHAALHGTWLAVDSVLMPARSVNPPTTPAPPLGTTYMHRDTHIYISRIVSLLMSSTCTDGW